MAKGGTGGVLGVGEEEPDGFGQHGKGGGGEVHEAEAPCSAWEESDVLGGEKAGGKGRRLFSPAGGGSEADNRALHVGEVAYRVGGEEAHLVHGFGREALVGSVDTSEEARVEVHPQEGSS